jgi:hypothetical protein
MIANRRRPGTTSRNSASRLPARSLDCIDRPVTLPPGRARLVIRPLPTGSSTSAKTIGTTDDACFAATAAFPPVTMTSTLSRMNSAAISAKRSARPSAQRFWIASASLDPAEFVQSLHKSGGPRAPRRRRGRPQEPDSRQLACLLRACGQRPYRRGAAEERDELASVPVEHGAPSPQAGARITIAHHGAAGDCCDAGFRPDL